MRVEQEMFDLIIRTANKDKRVRAAYINGSRTNPNVEKDEYQDYDIVFVVTETNSFLANKNWISIFGEVSIVCALEHYLSDSLCIKLLDKDHMLPDIPESNDSLYYIKKTLQITI